MKINKYEKRYKDYLALQKEYNELWEEIRKRPPIQLKEPYQDGWFLYIDFRDDIKNRVDYPHLKQVLDLSATTWITKNPRLIKSIRSNRRFDFIHMENNIKGFTSIYGWIPHLRSIRQSVYEKLSADVQTWFEIDGAHEKWVSFRGHYYYCTLPRFWMVMKSKPNIITQRYEVGGPLSKRLKEVRDKLRNYHEFEANYSKSYPASKDRTKVRGDIQKFKKGEIEDIAIEKTPLEYHY